MKLSELKYGSWFLHTVGEQQTVYIKSNRVEGWMRICFNKKGEVLDLPEDIEIKPIEKEKENDEDHD